MSAVHVDDNRRERRLRFNRWRFDGFDSVGQLWRAHDLVMSMHAFNCGEVTWALSAGYETPDDARDDFVEILHREFARYAEKYRQVFGHDPGW